MFTVTHTMAEADILDKTVAGAPGNVLAIVNTALYNTSVKNVDLYLNGNLLTDAQVLFVCGVFEAHQGIQRLDNAVNDEDLHEGCWGSYDYLYRLLKQLGA